MVGFLPWFGILRDVGLIGQICAWVAFPDGASLYPGYIQGFNSGCHFMLDFFGGEVINLQRLPTKVWGLLMLFVADSPDGASLYPGYALEFY